MEECLWSNFPDVLFLNVLSFLPLDSLLKFRTVCKRWNSSIPHDSEFRESRAKVYGPFHEEFIQCMLRSSRFQDLRILSCVGGLILMSDLDFQSMYVIEPSTGLVKQIPCLQSIRSPGPSEQYRVGMVFDPGTRRFTIFVGLSDSEFKYPQGESMNVVCYRSDLGGWRGLGAVAPLLMEQYPTLQGVVVYRDKYLILLRTRKHVWRTHFYRVMVYEESHAWARVPGGVPGDFPPFEFKTPLLFNHKGRLFLAILFMDACYIWEYQEQRSTWVLFDELLKPFFTPEEMSQMTKDQVGVSRRRNLKDMRRQVEKLLYRQVGGDFLYFGRWSEADDEMPFVMMRYNLVDRRWDDMPLEEAEQTLIARPQGGRRFFYHTNGVS